MGARVSTLLDLLSSHQFQIVILLTLGLDTCDIADLLDIGEPTVCRMVCDSLDLAGCRPEGLTARLLYECQNRLYDDRLGKELAALQDAAKKMLERIGRININ